MLDSTPLQIPYGVCKICLQPISIPGLDRSYCREHKWVITELIKPVQLSQLAKSKSFSDVKPQQISLFEGVV